MNNVEEIFSKIEKKITDRADELKGYNALFKFNLSGEQGGNWLVDLRPDSMGVRKDDGDADCTFSSSDKNFIKLINKELRPEAAILLGKIKLSGNVALAMQIASIFK
ncbi:MAG: hypothetical protein GTO02_13005 [Candidatus Dadabacteria bacterium]|nr:hypothetical protein [Candidatus Dadabacteria bacterium]NIQ15269.1 hypothetical protein [Candidatus Dadabacteria bacterium]